MTKLEPQKQQEVWLRAVELAGGKVPTISFTSGSHDKQGGPDLRIFKSPKGEAPYEYGWIIKS
ncbi:hypothetical protein GNF10_30335 [Nostoc sp. UCD121]|uniref:hypothetical protein n=1 Tax=unclassified Nostoc TaxID=2593658 RepID=UPI00162A6AB7|nr:MULTISPECIES: hypothetical protein [unclassified Nostoc]MBC1225043.1 hypothetical protein [Nostoc sp. UCD120]MBC1280131.1 hypothetical protein [Nostoc sp. UCD121]MBC1296466.1 hypothetical protein [Nostoc sp. UCD122]